MSSNLENTTADAAAETNPVQKWSDIEVEPRSPRGNHTPSSNQDHRAERPSFGRPHIQDEIDPDVLRLAEAFYLRYKSACHGVTRRPELQRLYEDTFESWVPKDANRSKTDFSKVLFALARGMKVVRVVDGGRQLVWRVFNNQRDERSERPDRRQDEHHMDQRRPQREFIPRDDRRQDERSDRRQDERRPNLADIVSNQQKMIETLMAKVMKADN